MKLYFDTNIIYKFFDKIVEIEKNKKPMEDSIKIAPKKIEFLYNIKDQQEYFVSNITRAEVFRYLHSGLTVSSEDCFKFWNFFKEILNVREIIVERVNFDRIALMLSKETASKGIIINLQHLLTAEENNLTVLTGDKSLKEKFSKFYEKVITYIELRKKIKHIS